MGCVNKRLKGEEQHGQVGTEEPKGTEGPMVVEEDPSAVEGVGDTPVEVLEAGSPDPPPRSP